jgi:hypothetical protein
MKVGDAVEVQVLKGRWISGKVKSLQRDGTSVVKVDDIAALPANVQPELIVDEENIREKQLDKKSE